LLDDDETNNRMEEFQGGLFGGVSDIITREQDELRNYVAYKRLQPAGPRPPVPPVGGSIYLSDAANSINRISSLQTYFSTSKT
jgi:hypothetical protein